MLPNAPIPLLAPEYLQSLPALQYTPDSPYITWHPINGSLHPLGIPQYSLMPLYPLLAPEYLQTLPAPKYTHDTPTLLSPP